VKAGLVIVTALARIVLAALLSTAITGAAAAEPAERWNAPFGGAWSAYFTVASDYSYSGISASERQPVFQAGLDYRSPNLIADVPLTLYFGTLGSNVRFPASGPGFEIDFYGGFKYRAFERRLTIDFGYLRYLFPGSPGELAYDYGDIQGRVDYDFGPATLSGRVRFSPNAFGGAGPAWNKRALLSVPMPFLKLHEAFVFKAYGSLGHFSVDRPLQYGIGVPDYWYWQLGLVTSAFGLDMTIAYADTTLERSACGSTHYCEGRLFVSITKVF